MTWVQKEANHIFVDLQKDQSERTFLELILNSSKSYDHEIKQS